LRPRAAVPRIGILIVAYNAVSTIASVLDRIPAEVWREISEVAVFDDASHDATHELALQHGASKRFEKLTVLRHPQNLGYGGNQKAGYAYFAERGFDIVVLLHGDGQYAPEVLRSIYEPIVSGRADAVFGSRMMQGPRSPISGGMPMYKYVGNRVLTGFENAALGMELSEFHSGYRAYSLAALNEMELAGMTDDFHFDTEIIIKLHHAGRHILEVPIPTYYGDEICNVDGLRYARDVARSVVRYRRTVSGRAAAPEFKELASHYPLKQSKRSSHAVAEDWLGGGQRVLDLGCGDGHFAARLAEAGNEVVGVDRLDDPEALDAMSKYLQADLDGDLEDLAIQLGNERFDRILLMDVLEHLRSPEDVLAMCSQHLKPDGRLLISVPNVANLTVRLALLAGRWHYTDRGILDRTHMRYFTDRSASRMLNDAGYEIARKTVTPIPFEVALVADPDRRPVRAGIEMLYQLTRLWRGGLGYQFVYEARAADR
jgi:2-polyprenyl-3-methyl-5-hydroxy-6-metoxy-1,4-benzoquinol methylase